MEKHDSKHMTRQLDEPRKPLSNMIYGPLKEHEYDIIISDILNSHFIKILLLSFQLCHVRTPPPGCRH